MRRLCAVYGGSRGIGEAVARAFFNSGYSVAILSRKTANLDNAVEKIAEEGSGEEKYKTPNQIKQFMCDVMRPVSVHESVTSILEHFQAPAVDVLVNCAGVLHTKLLMATSDEQIMEQVQTNLLGTIYTCRAHLKHMMKQRSGSIVSIGSSAGAVGWPGQSVYAATKQGLVGFSRNLAAEVASRGITVNVVSPGLTETEMTSSLKRDVVASIPLGRMCRPDEVADLVKFVAESKYMTGQVCIILGVSRNL